MEQQNERKTRKRILFNVTDTVHEEIRKRAWQKHLTIREYILRAVSKQMKEDDQFK